MRGTVAKKLREQARETHQATPVKVKWYKKIFKNPDTGQKTETTTGTIRNTGYRAEYLRLKKLHKLNGTA